MTDRKGPYLRFGLSSFREENRRTNGPQRPIIEIRLGWRIHWQLTRATTEIYHHSTGCYCKLECFSEGRQAIGWCGEYANLKLLVATTASQSSRVQACQATLDAGLAGRSQPFELLANKLRE
jgi:hypothetical protein